MSKESQPLGEKAVELSKKVDKIMIIGGTGMFVVFGLGVGAILAIGSVLTYIPADMFEKRMKKRKNKG